MALSKSLNALDGNHPVGCKSRPVLTSRSNRYQAYHTSRGYYRFHDMDTRYVALSETKLFAHFIKVAGWP